MGAREIDPYRIETLAVQFAIKFATVDYDRKTNLSAFCLLGYKN